MVEYSVDTIFQALADETRRDIVRRTAGRQQTISELACCYQMSFAGVAKHVAVLEKAQLVKKSKEGREQMVRARSETVEFAQEYLRRYECLWNERFDQLEKVLTQGD